MMLRAERMLSEQLFKRANGAMTIVATPTLAQGLNLPLRWPSLPGTNVQLTRVAAERISKPTNCSMLLRVPEEPAIWPTGSSFWSPNLS
ncbi:hypothetical protein CTI14_16090 [Methylobacterium radiotolerans]|nr:hypothetical protein CTI14_16090 [Methylobacterium radiotolerans]